jgi:hypothetical protein
MPFVCAPRLASFKYFDAFDKIFRYVFVQLMLNSSLPLFFRSPLQLDRSFLTPSRSDFAVASHLFFRAFCFPESHVWFHSLSLVSILPCFHVPCFQVKRVRRYFSKGSNILRILPTISGSTRWASSIVPAVVELVLCIVEPVWICSALNYVDMIVRVAFSFCVYMHVFSDDKMFFRWLLWCSSRLGLQQILLA